LTSNYAALAPLTSDYAAFAPLPAALAGGATLSGELVEGGAGRLNVAPAGGLQGALRAASFELGRAGEKGDTPGRYEQGQKRRPTNETRGFGCHAHPLGQRLAWVAKKNRVA
jgi:hypothetical protein